MENTGHAEALLFKEGTGFASRSKQSDIILAISPPKLEQVSGCVKPWEVRLKLLEDVVHAFKEPMRKARLLKQLALQQMQENEDVRQNMPKKSTSRCMKAI